MMRFAQLYADLDGSTSTQRKCGHIVNYLRDATPADAAWAVFFLIGGRLKRTVPTRLLQRAACDLAGIPDWLFEQSYQAVGDLAETIALLLPLPTQREDMSLAACIEERVMPLRNLDEAQTLQAVCTLWSMLDPQTRFLFVKWVGGGLRVGVSRALVVRALAQWTGMDARILAQRMIAFAQLAQPKAEDWLRLIEPQQTDTSTGTRDLLPYPFFLAHPLEGDVSALGAPQDWMAEWKYDGIRAQIVKRNGHVNVWSRGEELINDTFPEIVAMAQQWPDGHVLDGELLVLDVQVTSTQAGKPAIGTSDSCDASAFRPASFASLQVRLGRKRVDAKLQASHPVVFMAYDLLECNDQDLRYQPQSMRRLQLEQFCIAHQTAATPLKLAPLVPFTNWGDLAAQRTQSRVLGVEGLMLKRCDSHYGVGRTRSSGLWIKWKVDPLSIDAVLVYAQAGHGRRASLYTDYTFAVWDRAPSAQDVTVLCEQIRQRQTTLPPDLPQLVTFAKAYSGLSDEEFKRVDRIIRQTLLEKFGPVRRVVPSLVFEIGFEGIAPSTRHKSGVAVRFPRMLRIRDDKPLEQAATLEDLHVLLKARHD